MADKLTDRPGKRFTRSDPDPRISNPWDQTRFDPGSLLNESDGGDGGDRDGVGSRYVAKVDPMIDP